MYKVVLDTGYERIEAEDENLLAAFNSLKIDNPKTTRSVISVTKGDKTITKIFNMKITRLFARNPITRSIWSKLIEQGFNG